MKFIIIALIAVAAVCGADEQQLPDNFQLLNPEFLRRTSWAHQAAYHTLQDEIDQTITDINSMIAVVLVDTTSSTIRGYETHGNSVWGVRTAVNTDIGVLQPSECKNNSLRLNDEAVESSGYRSSNCITTYNKNVKKEVDAMSEMVNEINFSFGEVALSVYRSYVGVNPMVDGEAIERHINSTFNAINSQWLAIKPDINTLRTTLTNNINGLTISLDACFTNSYNYMNSLAAIVRDQIDYCNAYGGARFNSGYEKILQQFNDVKNNFPHFVWE